MDNQLIKTWLIDSNDLLLYFATFVFSFIQPFLCQNLTFSFY